MSSDANGNVNSNDNGRDDVSGEGTENKEKANFNVIGQYIKDFSFESPNAYKILSGPGKNPNLQISVNVNAEKLNDQEYEVVLDFKAAAKDDENVIYNIEILYAGCFRLQNIPQEALRPLLLIDCPALMFPFVRRLVADITREGGFPPLLLDPLDFASLYRNRLAQEAEKTQSHQVN